MTAPAIAGPPGFDERALLRPLSSGGLRESGSYRKALCRADPLLFALTYLPRTLRGQATGNRISLAQFHIDIAEAAQRWVRQDFGPSELREAWIAPRDSGKSSWLFKVLPIWALAYGHRRFVMAFSDSGGQARTHLDGIKRQLVTNRWLREDFPDLCAPRGGARKGSSDTAETYIARSGVAIMAKGITAATLGAKVEDQRPDLILFDDVEPKGADYSADQKLDRLDAIVNGILPMSLNAVVQLAGTTTMHGSITHDLVRSALGEPTEAWVAEQNFRARYFPPIVADADGVEHSYWEQRWSLEYLQSIRSTRGYAMNFANQPVSADGSFWERDDFVYRDDVPVTQRVVSVDPAVTHKATSDKTGIAVVGADLARSVAVVEYAVGVSKSPKEIREQVLDLIGRGRGTVREVIVEANQGGDVWADVLKPLPPGVRLRLYHSHAPKPVRYAEALDRYQRRTVFHSRSLPAFEEQAVAYRPGPNSHDDVLDAVTAGIEHWLGRQR